MIQILPLANIIHQETILEDDFNSKYEGWELIENEDEQSFINKSYYWMYNKSDSRWMFYHKAMPLDPMDNFMIKAEIDLILNKNGYGQFGLVWGFNKPHLHLNKFVVSTHDNSFAVANFEKDHQYTRNRFSGQFEKQGTKQYFSIVKLADYYYFYLQEFGRPVYVVHKSQLKMEGNRFGFYVEPKMLIRCNKISIKKLIIDQNFDGRLWMPLNENEMPLGCEILKGN